MCCTCGKAGNAWKPDMMDPTLSEKAAWVGSNSQCWLAPCDHVMLCYAMPCHVISCGVIRYDVMSCDVKKRRGKEEKHRSRSGRISEYIQCLFRRNGEKMAAWKREREVASE